MAVRMRRKAAILPVPRRFRRLRKLSRPPAALEVLNLLDPDHTEELLDRRQTLANLGQAVIQHVCRQSDISRFPAGFPLIIRRQSPTCDRSTFPPVSRIPTRWPSIGVLFSKTAAAPRAPVGSTSSFRRSQR